MFRVERSVVVPNGIDVAALDALVAERPREDDGAGDERVIGTVARFDPVKGLDVLVRALARIPKATLVLVGGGAQEARLRTDVAALGLGDRVRFTGVVERAPRLFGGWTVFASASRREGLPLSILEAMACRLPVVASDIAGHREVVAPATTGLLARADDPEAFATAIERVLSDAALARRMGEAGRARVVEGFAVAPMVEALAAIYRAAARREVTRSPRSR
jgi:glycosyltransferase involved in cell wall biosynthesis